VKAAALYSFVAARATVLTLLVGRLAGDRVLARWPPLKPGAERVRQLLERYDTPLIIGVRFLYGCGRWDRSRSG